VESIYINQTNTEEKNGIISQMAIIYRNATLTIVAASGGSADAGLPGISSCLRRPEIRVQIKSKSGNWKLLPVRPRLSNILANSTWNTRAWTYQEELFSTRCLFFADRECFWTCPRESTTVRIDWRESYEHEVNDESLMLYDPDVDCWWRKLQPMKSVHKSLAVVETSFASSGCVEKKWRTIITEYTVRALTNQADIIAAIESTAATVCKTTDLDCIRRYGFWHRDISGLRWTAKSILTRARHMADFQVGAGCAG
jgi:hypothetical protein